MTYKSLVALVVTMLMAGANAALADTDRLGAAEGWQRLTALPENPEDYYYVFVESTSTDIALRAHLNEHPYFHTLTEATLVNGMMWGVRSGSQSGALSLYNTASDNEKWLSVGYGGGCWDTQLLATSASSAYTDFEIVFADGTCTIQNRSDYYTDTGARYLGLWSPANGYRDGEKVAGNKSAAEAARFVAYAIAKSVVGYDVTSEYLVNTSFETGDLTGWATPADADNGFLQESVDNMESLSASHAFRYWWINANTTIEQQTMSALPAGTYRLEATVANQSVTTTLSVAGQSVVTDAETVKRYALEFESDGTLRPTVRLAVNMEQGAGAVVSWVAIDDVKLLYFGAPEAEPVSIDYTLSADYGTLILPFDAALPSGMTAYSCCAENDGTLTLTAEASIAANTPYIVGGTAGKYTFEGVATNQHSTYTSGWLTGVMEEQAAPVGSYVLQVIDDELAFYLVVSGKQPTVGAYHAYLNAPAEVTILPNSQQAHQWFGFGDEATGIKAMLDGSKKQAAYDLQGRRVTDTSKRGIYIINGKKVAQ